MQQPVGPTLNGGHRLQMAGLGTTKSHQFPDIGLTVLL